MGNSERNSARTYKHVIWDWNGTLLDDAWLCADIMNRMLLKRGMPGMTLERYQRLFGFPVREYYQRLGFDFDEEPFEISGTEFIVEYEKRRNDLQLQSGARQTLEAVAGLGLTQSLLSAYKQNTLDELTEHLGVRRYFVKLIGLDNHYAHGKMENGKRWMNEMRYGPHEVLLVGDTVHDHEVAQGIGADCVLIPCKHHTRDRLATCGVPIVDSLARIVQFVKGEDWKRMK